MKLLLILFGTLLAPAQPVHSLLPEPGAFKTSGGLLVRWNGNANDHSRDAIEAFDRHGVRVFGIGINKLMPSAKMVSIYDVAVRQNESIAIAAVSVEENDNRPRAWLLRLDWGLRLEHMIQLDAAKTIGRLEFDAAGNIWGLTDYPGEKVHKDALCNGTPCPLGPLILVFNPEGKIVKSLLKQADFPDGLWEASDIGQVTFGLTGDKVWFWQPAKTRMVITDREGRDVRKRSIPQARTQNLGGRSLLMPTGEVFQDLHSPTPSVRGIYLASTHHIKKYGQPQDAFLAGMDGSEFVFLSQTGKSGNFQMVRITSLAELHNLETLLQPQSAERPCN